MRGKQTYLTHNIFTIYLCTLSPYLTVRNFANSSLNSHRPDVMPYWNKYACSSSFFCKKLLLLVVVVVVVVVVVTPTKPEQHTMKAGYQRTTEYGYTGHCTHTSESYDVKYKIFNMESNFTYTINCNYRIAVTLYTLEAWFVSGVLL
jgi:hypothetical protein